VETLLGALVVGPARMGAEISEDYPAPVSAALASIRCRLEAAPAEPITLAVLEDGAREWRRTLAGRPARACVPTGGRRQRGEPPACPCRRVRGGPPLDTVHFGTPPHTRPARSRMPAVRPWLAAVLLAAFAGAPALAPGQAAARDQIRIVGSSTVFPFSTAVAERFGRTTEFETPVVESTGSGGGLKLFCGGVGEATPDIANSSRRIKASEVALCESNGVERIVEIKLGYDGIVLANSAEAKRYTLTTKQIFLALAREVPVAGKLVENPHRTWQDVDPALRDVVIEVLGPPPTSGTRDAFVELAMEKGALEFGMLRELREKDEKAFKAVAHAIREDGAYVEAGENDNLIVRKLEANPDALGIFGFSYLDQNLDRIQGSIIDGAPPDFEEIASGEYSISRALYVYVKKAHVGKVPGLAAFIAELTSDRAAGEDGYLVDKGLIPLPEDELERVRETAAKLEPVQL